MSNIRTDLNKSLWVTEKPFGYWDTLSQDVIVCEPCARLHGLTATDATTVHECDQDLACEYCDQ